MIGDRKSYIALGGIVIAIIAGELLSRQVTSRRMAPPVDNGPSARVVEPISYGPPANPKRLPVGFSPLGDAQVFGKSILTIKNGTDIDALVKVMMLIDGKPSMVRNFYVPAQTDWSEQNMPQGTFILRIAQGLDYDLPARRFTYRRSFAESIPFDLFEQKWTERVDGRVYTKTSATNKWITLHKVPHGNFPTEPIDESRFAR